MTKYSNYKFKDFVSDETFYNYVKCLNATDVEAWERWLNKNTENKKIAEEAKRYIQLLSFKKKLLPKDYINNEWLNLITRIDPEKQEPILKQNRRFNFKVWRNVAAAFLIF